jgi:hypothetical protein
MAGRSCGIIGPHHRGTLLDPPLPNQERMGAANNLDRLEKRIPAEQINRQRLGETGAKNIFWLASETQRAETRECLALGHGSFYNDLTLTPSGSNTVAIRSKYEQAPFATMD